MIVQKERIVSRLIARNTLAPDLREELMNYDGDESMKKVLSLIAREWYLGELYDIYDYELFEIPEADVYCFRNIRTYARFDVYLNNYNGNGKACTFGYVDSRSVTQDAENSDEAIRNYSI